MRKPIDDFLDIKTHIHKKVFHPHKFVLLLAIAKLYEENAYQENKFNIDDLEERFNKIFCKITNKSLPNYQLIDHPFYYLQSEGFWFLKIKDGKIDEFNNIVENLNSRFTKKRINDVFEYAHFSKEVHCLFRNERTRKDIVNKIMKICTSCMPAEKGGKEEVLVNNQNFRDRNIISYLNSLQRSNGGNENALAEFQAQSVFFARISVQHPLEETIAEELRNGHHCIILTGHAGDGKTTLAFAVYRRLCNIAADEFCAEFRESRVQFTVDGNKALLIKDLSEQKRADHSKLMSELLDSGTRSLLVSNTGALREFFLSQVSDASQTIDVESRLLSALSREQDDSFTFKGRNFKIYNLALRDNIPLAEQVLINMLADDLWSECVNCHHAVNCPVNFNRQLMKDENSPAKQRLFLAYRRLQAYGIRLTMRQLTEHMAYCLTGGLETRYLCRAEKFSRDIGPQYYMYNLFFGGPHAQPQSHVSDMAAIRGIHGQQIGLFPLPSVEKRLWHIVPPDQESPAGHFGVMQLAVPELKKLLYLGCRHQEPLVRAEARLQARRLLYFCAVPQEDMQKRLLLEEFLQSRGILLYDKLRKEEKLEQKVKYHLFNCLFHVLQEHFTGIQLPAGRMQNRPEKLYITLNMPTQLLRQSVQMVICSVSWDENFELRILKRAGGPYLVLSGRRNLKNLTPLELTIPFLDYVLHRYNGELTTLPRTTFSQQLDTLKAQIIRCMREDDESNSMRLLRYCSDYKLVQDEYILSDGFLEVIRGRR